MIIISSLRETMFYDRTTNTFSKGPLLPGSLSSTVCMAEYSPQKVFILGFLDNYTVDLSTWRFEKFDGAHLSDSAVMACGAVPAQKGASASSKDKEVVVILESQSDDERQPWVFIVNFFTREVRRGPPFPEKADESLSAASFGDTFLVFGGLYGGSEEADYEDGFDLGTVYEFDWRAEGRWVLRGNMAAGRHTPLVLEVGEEFRC